MRVLACVVLAACGTNSPASFDDAEATNVAMAIASTLQPPGGGGELGAMLDAAVIVRGEMPVGFAESPDGRVRGSHLGFGYDYKPACRDDHNVARGCDVRTDNADIGASWAGLIVGPEGATVVVRDGSWMLNDIVADKLRLDGESHLELASEIANRGDTMRHELAYDASHRGLMVFRGERWPRTGEIRYELSVARTIDGERRTYDVRATAQFHASGHVTIVLPDHEVDLDLATGSLQSVE